MSWFTDKKEPGVLMKFCYNVMKAGRIPRHVALIMDGNRRFARRIHVDKRVGHSRGFDKLTEVLQWCFELGVQEVTVYAFSIENFKRSKDEVDTLMQLAEEKFNRLYEERELLMKNSVRVQVVGDLTMLPEGARRAAARVIQLTQDNHKHTLNVAMAYTSRHEMTQSIQEVVAGIQEGKLDQTDVSFDLLQKCFYSSTSCDVDLLIRTSGEVRLSDFMLYQSSYAVLVFLKCLWPEMTVCHFFYAIVQYQLGYNKMQEARNTRRQPCDVSTRLETWTKRSQVEVDSTDRETEFLYQLEGKRRQYISACAGE